MFGLATTLPSAFVPSVNHSLQPGNSARMCACSRRRSACLGPGWLARYASTCSCTSISRRMLATNCPVPGRMDAAQASPVPAWMAVSREQNDHPLVPRTERELRDRCLVRSGIGWRTYAGHLEDTGDMNRVGAETHLRLLAEAELRRATRWPADGGLLAQCHSGRLELVALALHAVRAFD